VRGGDLLTTCDLLTRQLRNENLCETKSRVTVQSITPRYVSSRSIAHCSSTSHLLSPLCIRCTVMVSTTCESSHCSIRQEGVFSYTPVAENHHADKAEESCRTRTRVESWNFRRALPLAGESYIFYTDAYSRIVLQARHNPGELFVLHDGPPYANGNLHMGELSASCD